MNEFSIESRAGLTDAEKFRIAALWTAEYPADIAFFSVADFEEFLESIGNRRHFIATAQGGEIAGWLISFDRDGERWFSIIVDETFKGRGIGRGLLDLAFDHDRELNGWVVPTDEYFTHFGKPYKSPLGFYLKYGFDVIAGEKFAKTLIDTVKIRLKKQ